MNFIEMNEKINFNSRIILHSDNVKIKKIFKNKIKFIKYKIKTARIKWNLEHANQIKKINVA